VSGSAVPPGSLALSPASLAFGSVDVGQSVAKTATLTNSGSTSVTVSQDAANSAAFTISGLSLPATLAAGQSATITVTYAPKASGTVNGNVTISGNASLTMGDGLGLVGSTDDPISASLSVSGNGAVAGQFVAIPASLAFSSVTVGSTQGQTVSLTNSGGTSATISQATVIGTGVSISGLGLPLTLTPGQSTSFTASFTPTTAGTTTGSIAITSTATNPSLRIPFSGVGATTGALVASPDSIAFGSVLVGGAQSHSEMLSNTGGSTVHISGATVTGAGFSVSGISVPTTLNAGQSLTFNVNFNPQSSGAPVAAWLLLLMARFRT